MKQVFLRLHAPFAAFRPLQAGAYRVTAPVMPPSAALGLLLNLAGIEMRDPAPRVTTAIRDDVPRLCLAVGTLRSPGVCSLYQQLHSYPVGASGKELAKRTHGAKYWIAPVRRELLVDYEGIVGVVSDSSELLTRMRLGLRGEHRDKRYGLPFAGDNSFLFDRIEFADSPPPTYWYEKISGDSGPREGSCRLTIGIDREDNTRTTVGLFAPVREPSPSPPENAWVWVPGPPDAEEP